MIIIQLLRPKWILTTILVVAAIGVNIRLGFWQLDRLDQRREFNSRVSEQLEQPEIVLNADSLTLDLGSMEYRDVRVSGLYNYELQVALVNRARNGLLGVDLLTPLKITDTDTYVLVNRGWIPAEDFDSGRLAQYDQPGMQTVVGMIRQTQSQPSFGGIPDATLTPGQTRLHKWKMINVERIRRESGLPMLQIYIQQAPLDGQDSPPFASLPELELTEGPHLGYALQWFSFAAIIGFGYPVFVRRHSDGVEKAETDLQGRV